MVVLAQSLSEYKQSDGLKDLYNLVTSKPQVSESIALSPRFVCHLAAFLSTRHNSIAAEAAMVVKQIAVSSNGAREALATTRPCLIPLICERMLHPNPPPCTVGVRWIQFQNYTYYL